MEDPLDPRDDRHEVELFFKILRRGARDELLAIRVPLAALADPGRTPLIAPFDTWTFRYDPVSRD